MSFRTRIIGYSGAFKGPSIKYVMLEGGGGPSSGVTRVLLEPGQLTNSSSPTKH